VEIIANDQGNRTTPSYVAFTDTERLIGDAAKNQVAMNPTNTVFGKGARLACLLYRGLARWWRVLPAYKNHRLIAGLRLFLRN